MSSDTTIYPVFPEQMIRAVKTYFFNNFTHEKAAHDKKYSIGKLWTCAFHSEAS